MNLKNYTSSVPVTNSISKIEHKLAQAGATHIAKSYEKERPVGMIFQIPINGIPTTFKLPAKANRVFDYMVKQRSRPPKKNQLDSIRMQADRTGWKILADWIDIQVSIIQLDQAEPIEACAERSRSIFLPYVYDSKTERTLFDKLKESNFKLLNE